MFFPVSDAASVAGQWLAAGVLTMADLFGIPWQLLAVSVIYTVIYTTANVGHGVLWDNPSGHGRGAVCDDTQRILEGYKAQAEARAARGRS